MSQRTEESYNTLIKALSRLEKAIDEDLAKGSIVIDGTIQRFEFTYYLALKLAKRLLAYEGIEAEAPRMIIKEAYKIKLIDNGEQWLDMLADRNKTSHIYDEKQAESIYRKIKESHFSNLKDFQDKAYSLIKNNS